MKRSAVIFIALLLCALLLAACGGGASSSSAESAGLPVGAGAPPGAGQSDIDDSSSAPPAGTSVPGSGSQPASAASSPAEEDPSGVTVVTGVIDDAGMGKLYVELEDGVVVGFEYHNADTADLEDTRPGSPITVHYTGTLNGSDASAVVVVKMETPK